MFGNQWFFAKKGDFTAVLLSRTERYEYTSPVGSEVFHDYNIYTSSLKLRPSRNNIYTWPPLQNQMLRVGGGKYDGGEKIVDMKMKELSLWFGEHNKLIALSSKTIYFTLCYFAGGAPRAGRHR